MRNSGPIKMHRIWNPDTDRGMTAGTANAFYLLVADDDPLDNSYSDLGNTNVAECEADSRILRFSLALNIKGTSNDKYAIWLIRNKDQGITLSTATLTSAQQGDEGPTSIVIRKNTLALKTGVIRSDRTDNWASIRVSRAALKRAGLMEDNDRLQLMFYNYGANAMQITQATGRIWTRRN